MAINYFIGWTVGDLEAELRAAQEDLAAGKSTIQAGAGDASVQNRIEKSVESRIKMILWALYKASPDEATRAKYSIDQVTAITMTKAAFS